MFQDSKNNYGAYARSHTLDKRLPARVMMRTFLLLLFLAILSVTTALKQPTSYCKCICFQNSTIIPLNSPPSESSAPSQRSILEVRAEDNDEESQKQHHHTLTCADCNRAFCLDYNLPICKNAKEEDVFAQCFQRDSLKDRLIVTLFIIATASLLLWALTKPYIVKSGVGDVVQKYKPIRADAGSELPRPNASLGSHNSNSRHDRTGRSHGGASGMGLSS